MLDPRIYRAGMIPVLLALVLVAFSLEDRPRPFRTTLPPDAFQGTRAHAELARLAAAFPSRRPGSADDVALSRRVATQMRRAGFAVRTHRVTAQTIEGEQPLTTIVAERAGIADSRVVVVAHRDAAGRGAAAELSGTAALLELARVFGAGQRRTRRTLTLVSTSGGSGGAAGAAALAGQLRRPVGAVLALGDLASRDLRGPVIQPWSNELGASPLRLRRTLEDAVSQETDTGRNSPRALTQIARLAVPGTLGEQGPLLARGLPAVGLSVSGERPPAADAAVSPARLQAFGRAALRTLTALDGAAVPPGVPAEITSSDLITRRKVLPGWAVRLLVGVLLIAPLVTALDVFARVRRRGEPLAAWLSWTLAGALPFILAALFVLAMATTGLLAAVPDGPVAPEALPVQVPALLAVALVFVLGWVGARPLALRLAGARRDPASPGAGAMVMLVLVAAAIVVWIGNPYAAALLVPAAHLWLFAVAPEFRMRQGVGVAVVALGVVPGIVVAVALSGALGLSVGEAAWMVMLLVAGGHVSWLGVLLWSIVGGCALGALLIAARGREAPGDDRRPITVRGPRSYAGPGSLGGTESALRR